MKINDKPVPVIIQAVEIAIIICLILGWFALGFKLWDDSRTDHHGQFYFHQSSDTVNFTSQSPQISVSWPSNAKVIVTTDGGLKIQFLGN